MTEEVQIESQTVDDRQNPAVTRCLCAWQAAYDQTMERLRAEEEQYQAEFGEEDDEDEYERESDFRREAKRAAENAFRDAMPPLAGRQNVRDFIACVACGLLKGVISNSESPRLLYAAQIAVSADGSSRTSRRAEG